MSSLRKRRVLARTGVRSCVGTLLAGWLCDERTRKRYVGRDITVRFEISRACAILTSEFGYGIGGYQEGGAYYVLPFLLFGGQNKDFSKFFD